MPARHFLPGMDGFRPRRPIPTGFFGMSYDEIVERLMSEGFSQKVAERDASAFDAYRGSSVSEQSENDARNDSVSETIWDRAIKPFRRR